MGRLGTPSRPGPHPVRQAHENLEPQLSAWSVCLKLSLSPRKTGRVSCDSGKRPAQGARSQGLRSPCPTGRQSPHTAAASSSQRAPTCPPGGTPRLRWSRREKPFPRSQVRNLQVSNCDRESHPEPRASVSTKRGSWQPTWLLEGLGSKAVREGTWHAKMASDCRANGNLGKQDKHVTS